MTRKKSKIIEPSDADIAQYASKSQAALDGAAESSDEGAASEAATGPDSRIAALRAECAELKDKLLRSQAECANISKRLQQHHVEALKLAGMGLARSLLPVLDSLEMTLGTCEASAAEDDPVVQGVRLIRDEFQKAFREHGIVPVEAEGRAFDPTMHEAMMQDRETEAPAGTVTRELQRGYTMHGRVLRPAKVAVAAGGADDEGTQAKESANGEEVDHADL